MNVVGKHCQVLYCERSAVRHIGGKDLCSVCWGEWLGGLKKWRRVTGVLKDEKVKRVGKVPMGVVVHDGVFNFRCKGKFKNYVVVVNG